MSLVLANSDSYSFEITASEAVKDLVEYISSKNYPLTVHVDVVSPSFYLTHERMSGMGGPCGWQGPRRPCVEGEARIRPPLSSDMQVVTVIGQVKQKRVDLPPSFKVSRGAKEQDVIQALTYARTPDYQKVQFGWYKQPGFDAALQAMRVLLPNLTEKELACFGSDSQPNPEIVEKRVYTPESDWSDCIMTTEGYEECGTKCWTFKMSCLDSDLTVNTPIIKRFLEAIAADLL